MSLKEKSLIILNIIQNAQILIVEKVQFLNFETFHACSTRILEGLNTFVHRGNEITPWKDHILTICVTCALHEIGVLCGATIKSSGMR